MRGIKYEVERLKLIVSINDEEINSFLQSLPNGIIDINEKKETLEERFMSFYKEDNHYGGISK